MENNINHQLISDAIVQRLQQKFRNNSDKITLETDKFFLWITEIFLSRIEDESREKERYIRFNFFIKDKKNESLFIECNETKDLFMSDPTLLYEEFIQIIKDVVKIFNDLPHYRAVYRENVDIYKSQIIVILGI